MCVEKREERHEKRDTHVCGSVRVSTGTEIYLAHTLTRRLCCHIGCHMRYVYAIRLYRARNKRTQRSSHKGGGIKQMPSLMWKR